MRNRDIDLIFRSRLLRAAAAYRPLLKSAFESYAHWLNLQGRMYFFPDFTDHGVPHLSRVVELADFLICNGSSKRRNSWKIVSHHDLLVLCGAILYHDIGMFLTPGAFLRLINDTSRNLVISELDVPWTVLWNAFLEESRLWDERIIRRIFGNAPWSHGEATRDLQQALKAGKSLSVPQKLLIGEFIRRHHPRIAHEIACEGWPGDDGPQLPLSVAATVSAEQRDLIGLVARSHGMGLRDTFAYLKRSHSNNLRESQGTHCVYLMTVLRVADILHIHAERAPGDGESILRLSTPHSRREWECHQAIKDIHLDVDEDPEAICVGVDSKKVHSAEVLFRLRQWHEMLQVELDHSWSVLGEVYGRHSHLSSLWLSLRRVKSNLFDRDFETQLKFAPCRAAFDTAQGEYLKLLVGPLYGDEPGVGIRELLQNSLDAIRERRFLMADTIPNWEAINPSFPRADVILAACSRDSNTPDEEFGGPPKEWEHWFEVVDRGCGMTAEIVRDYFLKAGATYRRSSNWQKLFMDSNGHSKVLRTGRFGVGALAAFLLGDQLQVITRHYGESRGIQFTARLEDDLIDLRYASRAVGTTIRVKLSKSIDDRWSYSWDWYRLSDPVVVRLNNGIDVDYRDELSRYELSFHSEAAELSPKWRRIQCSMFADVQWTYDTYFGTFLVCNGVTISSGQYQDVKWHHQQPNRNTPWEQERSTEKAICLRMPSVSVFDPDGVLPLTLTRDRLATSSYPFSEALLMSVMRDMLAYALVFGSDRKLTSGSHAYYRKLKYPGYEYRLESSETTQWASLESGFTLSQIAMLRWAGVRRCVILVSRTNARTIPNVKIGEGTALVAVKVNGEDSFWPLDEYFPRLRILHKDSPFPDETNWGGIRVLIRDNFKRFLESRNAKIEKNLDDEIDDEQTSYEAKPRRSTRLAGGKFYIIESDQFQKVEGPDVLRECVDWFSKRPFRTRNAGTVCEWILGPDQNPHENALVQLWRQIIGQPIIPYSMDERRKELAGAYEELAVEVSAWEETKRIEDHERLSETMNSEKGEYPKFLNQIEIKQYLKNHDVKRKVSVRKANEWYTAVAGMVAFSVYAPYSREELTAINPDTPQSGNPFKNVNHDRNLLPEFRLIERLLAASNAAHPTVMGPERE